MGVTRSDQNRTKTYLNKRVNKLKPQNYLAYFSGIELVANLEELIKNTFTPIKGSEYFDLKDKPSIDNLLSDNFELLD